MSRNINFSKQLKELIDEFVTSTGDILEYPKGQYYRKKQLDNRRVKLLRAFVELLLNTRMLRQETKKYISDKYITLKGVAEYMKAEGKETNANTVQSVVWFDFEKIGRKISKRILIDIIEYNKDIDFYEQKVLHALTNFTNGYYLFKNIALKLPEPIMTMEAGEEEFQDFLYCIQPFTPHHMKYLSENISAEMLGYAKYIISSALLSEVELERKELLLKLLYKEPC